MTGKERKRFELVEVFYDGKENVNNLICYVYDGFTKHITVHGISKLLQGLSVLSKEQCDAIVDPASTAVDHANESLGIGIIMCPASISKIRSGPVIHLEKWNISLEPTIFGLAVSGEVPQGLRDNINTICSQCIVAIRVCNHVTVTKLIQNVTEPLFKTESQREEELKSNLNFLGNQESLGIYPEEIHKDDETTWNHFVSTTVRNGQEFEVRMPFNDKVHMLKSNQSKAAGRTRSEQAEMIRNPAYMLAMCKAHQVFIDTNSVEIVDPAAPVAGPIYYMPFRGILKLGTSTECRICMDASSKPSASDVSLNQVLYQGPNMVLNLAVLLLKFMKGKYGTVADLEKAFLRIMIAPADRDVLRYFWFSDPNDFYSDLIVMRFKVVIFGSKASPFQLAAVLHVLIRDDCEDTFISNALQNCIYVDNVVFSEECERKLVKFYKVSRHLFRGGNFNLRQWTSNSELLMQQASLDEVAVQDKVVKVLGMNWNILSDTYSFSTGFQWDGKFTKRSVLAFACKVFDPLGLLAPITTRNKVFLQQLWLSNLKWDESFESLREGELRVKWQHLVSEAHIGINLHVPRRAVTADSYEIHIFSDASKDSYGAVTYVRTLPGTEFSNGNVSLAMAKGKVAPLKGNKTIPKLELAAVVVAANQVQFTRKAWDPPVGTKVFLWIDAKVVLQWLNQYNIKDTFVHNRVKQVRELCSGADVSIRYVPSELNPADLITKEQEAAKFIENQFWLKGPTFLTKEEDWPAEEEKFKLFPEGEEQIVSLFKIIVRDTKETSLLKFFESRTFLFNLRVLTMVLKILRSKSFRAGSISKEEVDKAKTTGIRIMQEEMFPEELAALQDGRKITTSNRKLNLYLQEGIIKCRGRLGNLQDSQIQNDPILVNGGHPFVRGFVGYLHRHFNCSSKRYTLNKVRQFMHGPLLTKAVESVCRGCYTCTLLRAAPYKYPKAPPLPSARLIARSPFAVCGVDYCGPFKVRQGRGKVKVWIALFTCMVSRAIFLQIVPDNSAESFLHALRALAWTYTHPSVLMSDNAPCFRAANKILLEMREQLMVKKELDAKGIKWIFTPTRAPWFGAIYERMIGTLKRELEKMTGRMVLTYFELDLHIKEIVGIINNRPLTAVGSEEVITPNNILMGRSDTDFNVLQVANSEEILDNALSERKLTPQLFKDTEKCREVFWTRFRQQYLESIKFDNKSSEETPGLTPQVGEVVSIFDENTHKLFWSKGLILELLPSEDGRIRKAVVKVNGITTVKAINHLYPLEARVEESIEAFQKHNRNFDFEGFKEGFEEQAKNLQRIETLKKLMATAVPECDEVN